jgi:hemoglobin
MRAAQDTLELPPLQDATLWTYLDRAAQSMVNTFDE